MKVWLFSFIFFTGCKGFNQSLKAFFKSKPLCEIKDKEFFNIKDPYQKRKLIQKAEICLKQEKPALAVFILEKLLESAHRQKISLREKKNFAKKLAEVSFYKLKDYEKALKYYTVLLSWPQEPGERFLFQYHLAKSFFYLEKHSQSLKEIEKCFFKGLSMEERKQALILKARILMAKKRFEQAISFFNEQIVKFPEEESFFREYMAFIYESKKDFVSAVKELKKIDKASLFITNKIEKLMERQSNQPGFR